jgi:hypothetical protein
MQTKVPALRHSAGESDKTRGFAYRELYEIHLKLVENLLKNIAVMVK